MNSRKSYRTKKAQHVEVGTILTAQPFWKDERYRRSVILLLEHDELGSTGIILNKPTTLYINDALPVLNITPPLYYGGPLDTSNISYIHEDTTIPEAVYIGNDLFWGGNFEYLEELILNHKIDLNKLKFFAGFVDWSAGELEAEINDSKWWCSELLAGEIFNTKAEELWCQSLLANGHMYGLLEQFPDPCIN